MDVPATLLLFSFLVLVVCIHGRADEGRKPFTLTALVLAAISVTILSSDYFVQLSVIQPSVLRGETDGIALLSQYYPHGVFIALEELGYLLMSAALLFATPAFVAPGRLNALLPWLFVRTFVLSVAARSASAWRMGTRSSTGLRSR